MHPRLLATRAAFLLVASVPACSSAPASSASSPGEDVPATEPAEPSPDAAAEPRVSIVGSERPFAVAHDGARTLAVQVRRPDALAGAVAMRGESSRASATLTVDAGTDVGLLRLVSRARELGGDGAGALELSGTVGRTKAASTISVTATPSSASPDASFGDQGKLDFFHTSTDGLVAVHAASGGGLVWEYFYELRTTESSGAPRAVAADRTNRTVLASPCTGFKGFNWTLTASVDGEGRLQGAAHCVSYFSGTYLHSDLVVRRFAGDGSIDTTFGQDGGATLGGAEFVHEVVAYAALGREQMVLARRSLDARAPWQSLALHRVDERGTATTVARWERGSQEIDIDGKLAIGAAVGTAPRAVVHVSASQIAFGTLSSDALTLDKRCALPPPLVAVGGAKPVLALHASPAGDAFVTVRDEGASVDSLVRVTKACDAERIVLPEQPFVVRSRGVDGLVVLSAATGSSLEILPLSLDEARTLDGRRMAAGGRVRVDQSDNPIGAVVHPTEDGRWLVAADTYDSRTFAERFWP